MAFVRLESEWLKRLMARKWSTSAVNRIQLCWAPSTLACYNSVLQKFQEFCINSNSCFPPTDTSVLAAFLCDISDKSDRPRASLNNAVAAVNALHKVGACAIYCDFDVLSLVSALVKSGTKHSLQKSRVLPPGELYAMFLSWEDNENLKLKQLRMKCIALLALSFMLRPSDIVPKGVTYNQAVGDTSR